MCTDVAFRVLCAQDVPDHCTIARFRSDCQDAFEDLFTQVLLIAAQSGLARFGTVAIDGTKIPANASIDANRGHDWFKQQVCDMVADANPLMSPRIAYLGPIAARPTEFQRGWPADPIDASASGPPPRRWPTSWLTETGNNQRARRRPWCGGAVQRRAARSRADPRGPTSLG